MAEEKQIAESTKAEKGSGNLKAILLILAVLAIEAGVIFGTMAFTGGPSEVSGQGIAADQLAEQNRLVELLVVKGRFDNQRTGRTFLYDTEIYVTVRHKHLAQFKEELESMKTQISVDVQTIFRRADPAHFQEPTRATLTRQIKAALDQRFGTSPEDEAFIHEVLIAKCLPYRADY